MFRLLNEDNMLELFLMPDNSIDSVVTDPPYGLSFMNKKWDHQVPSVEFWSEVFRVLKPGGYVLSFGGTRTYHRMVVNIEDAGFEIRDQILWLYGSGFPKSYNVSKGIDRKFGTKGEVLGVNPSSRPNSKTKGGKGFDAALGGEGAGVQMLTSPGHELAKKWSGFGSALKPANEPIVLARKPLSEKTIVDNVLKWGTGALNIDGCRVEGKPRTTHKDGNRRTQDNLNGIYGHGYGLGEYSSPQGRFPANVLLDEEAGAALDEQSGILKQGGFQKGSVKRSNVDKVATHSHMGSIVKKEAVVPTRIETDTYGASRFFYCAKASKSERNTGVDTNNHPTVKPVKLMQYLVRLVTPPGGTVLDPFMGSGTTGVACKKENFSFVGIELEKEYFKIAKRRVNSV